MPLLKNLFWSRFPIMMRAPLPSSGAADFPLAFAVLRDFLHSSSTVSNAGRIASLINVKANTLCTPLWSSITHSFGVAAITNSSAPKISRIRRSYAVLRLTYAHWLQLGSALDLQTWRSVGKMYLYSDWLGSEQSITWFRTSSRHNVETDHGSKSKRSEDGIVPQSTFQIRSAFPKPSCLPKSPPDTQGLY